MTAWAAFDDAIDALADAEDIEAAWACVETAYAQGKRADAAAIKAAYASAAKAAAAAIEAKAKFDAYAAVGRNLADEAE